jgi:hypothetical protein
MFRGTIYDTSYAHSHLDQNIQILCYYYRSRGSSVSIVSDNRLDDRPTGVRSPRESKDFSSSLCVQTDSGAHRSSYSMGTGGPFPGGKARPGHDADHSPHLVPRSRISRSYNSSPSCHLHGGSGQLYFCYYYSYKLVKKWCKNHILVQASYIWKCIVVRINPCKNENVGGESVIFAPAFVIIFSGSISLAANSTENWRL